MNRRWLLPASLLLAQAANLLVQLIIPRLLEPAEFSKFALAWAFGQFALVLSFEWLRVAVVRFSAGSNGWLSQKRRLALKRNYILVTAGLLLIAVISMGLERAWPIFSFVAVVSVFAACRGVLDGSQAFARAQSLDTQFVATWAVNSVLALAFTSLIALTTGSGELAALGLALSYAATLFITGGMKRAGRARIPAYNAVQSGFLLRYGAFVALTGAVSASIGPFVRYVAVSVGGPNEAAGMLLALDLSQKIVSAIGMVPNIVLLQKAINIAEGPQSALLPKKVGQQVAIVAAVILPAGVGFALIQPGLGSLFVPPAYLDSYLETVLIVSCAAALAAFRSYGIDTQFVIAGHSRNAIYGPLSTLIATGVWIVVGSAWLGSSLRLVAFGLLFGCVIGVAVSTYMARLVIRVDWPLRDLCVIACGCALMYVLAMMMRGTQGPAAICAVALVCGSAYVALLWSMNVADVRSLYSRKALNA